MPAELSDRVISIEFEKLRKIPEVIGIAGGAEKADAISVVLESGLLTGIITDVSAARRVLFSGDLNGASR